MAEYISNPRLTTVLAIQPSVLEEIMGHKAMNGRGLIARFLIAIPTSRIGHRVFVSQGIPQEVTDNFHAVLSKILNTFVHDKVHTLQLSEEAQTVIESYFKNVADLKPILDFLEEYGYIRQQSIPVVGTNRPSEIIHISPYIKG